MSSSSTSSLTIGSVGRLALRELLLERGQLAVADLGDALEVALALGALGLHPQLVDPARDLADPVERVLLLAPSARRARRAAPSPRRAARSTGSRTSADSLPIAASSISSWRTRAVGLVELERRASRSPSSAARRPRRRGRSPCRAAGGRRCSGRRARRRRRAPRRGCGRRGAPRSAPSARAGSRSCRRPTARRRRPAGSAARARRPSRCACGTRRASSRRPQRSSPRASIGLSRFAASTAPSAAPAPTIVCSSSMKRMIWPSAFAISASTAFSRSSNSPRYFAPGEQRADVERPDALALQALGHVAGDDPLREPLGDRRLADARLADQHRVVLRAAREHLDHAPDLLVAADHRVELARLGRARSGRGRTSRAPGRCPRDPGT